MTDAVLGVVAFVVLLGVVVWLDTRRIRLRVEEWDRRVHAGWRASEADERLRQVGRNTTKEAVK